MIGNWRKSLIFEVLWSFSLRSLCNFFFSYKSLAIVGLLVDDPGRVCQPGSEQNRALFGLVEKSSHILLIPSVYIYIVYIAYFHIFPKFFYGISVGFLCDFHDISMIFLWDYSNYPWVNGHIDLGNPWLKPFGTWSPNGGLGPFIWVWENGVYLAAIQWIWEYPIFGQTLVNPVG